MALSVVIILPMGSSRAAATSAGLRLAHRQPLGAPQPAVAPRYEQAENGLSRNPEHAKHAMGEATIPPTLLARADEVIE